MKTKMLALSAIIVLSGCATKQRMDIKMLERLPVDCDQAAAAQRFFEHHLTTSDERITAVFDRNWYNAAFSPEKLSQGNQILSREYDAVARNKLDQLRNCPSALPYNNPEHQYLKSQ
jgi:hypothetical protein